MEVLKGANNFTIGNFFASDGNGGKDVVAMALLEKLVNAACLGAGHQSDERYDAPKCHPETRAAVINDIMSWVNAKDSNEPIMWMSGPAGAGKSAISQTVCDKLDEDQKLLASFFFSRTATGPGRSEAKRLVPTIACLMAIVIPETRPIIIERLKSDSAMLTYSMEKQLHRLVLQPLAEMHKESCIDGHTPYVVVIDGLDECNDAYEQSRIVRMISGIFVGLEEPIQLRFLITSRPELEIRNSFESVIDSGMCAKIVLNEAYNPDEDIRTYLRSEFVALKREHTLRKSLQQEPGWPSFEAIKNLVKKSSGQFIYASTVIKYLRNQRRDPRQGLRGILETDTVQINSNQNVSPYIALDSLYKHVLASSSKSYGLYVIVFQILLFSYPDSFLSRLRRRSRLKCTLENLSEFTGIAQSELEIQLVDLHSLLNIPDIGEMKFYHASFGDFLKDESRSQNFYISEPEAHKYIAHRCLSTILEISPEIGRRSLTESQIYSVKCVFQHLKDSDFDEDLLTMLHSETTLHAMLEVLSKYKQYDSLNHVIIFSFNDCESATQSYWTPKIEKIQDICLEIVKFVEERFLIKMHSVGTLNGDDVVKALLRIALISGENFIFRDILHFKWLKFLLESSIHGNHLYLDSEKSFLLYKKLIQDTDENTRRHYDDGNDAYYPSLLKYLLEKIQPSADIDIDLFPCVSEQVLNEITENNSKNHNEDLDSEDSHREMIKQYINDLHSAVEKFLQCQVLKEQKEEDRIQLQEEDFKLRQEHELNGRREDELFGKQQEFDEDITRQQEEEMKLDEEDNRLQKDEELERQEYEKFMQQEEMATYHAEETLKLNEAEVKRTNEEDANKIQENEMMKMEEKEMIRMQDDGPGKLQPNTNESTEGMNDGDNGEPQIEAISESSESPADAGNASPEELVEEASRNVNQSWVLGILVLTTMVTVYWMTSRRV